jgi:hypothetical protein
MITLGLDPHPGSHTVVALNDNDVSMGHLTVPNTEEGLVRLHEFSGEFAFRRWAIEGAGNHFISLSLLASCFREVRPSVQYRGLLRVSIERDGDGKRTIS